MCSGDLNRCIHVVFISYIFCKALAWPGQLGGTTDMEENAITNYEIEYRNLPHKALIVQSFSGHVILSGHAERGGVEEKQRLLDWLS